MLSFGSIKCSLSLSKFHISEDSLLLFFINSTIDLSPSTTKITIPDEPDIPTFDHPDTSTTDHDPATSPSDISSSNELLTTVNSIEDTMSLDPVSQPTILPPYGSPLG